MARPREMGSRKPSAVRIWAQMHGHIFRVWVAYIGADCGGRVSVESQAAGNLFASIPKRHSKIKAHTNGVSGSSEPVGRNTDMQTTLLDSIMLERSKTPHTAIIGSVKFYEETR